MDAAVGQLQNVDSTKKSLISILCKTSEGYNISGANIIAKRGFEGCVQGRPEIDSAIGFTIKQQD